MADSIVGRDAQLDAIDRFLSRIAERPSALVISGEPGIGKTTLWRAAVARSIERGCLLLQSRPLPADVRRSYGAVADLLRDLDDGILATLPHPQAHALRVALRRAEPTRRGQDQSTVAAGFVSLLTELARARPLVLAIDDLQWLDRPSTRVLEHALRRLTNGGIGVLLAIRRERPDARTVPLSLDASLHGGVDEIELRGLGRDALHDLLRRRLGRSFPMRLVSRIDEASGGNPFYALEIARPLTEAPVVGPLAIPANLRDLVDTRIARLSRRSREVLLVVASLPAPSRSLVVTAAGGDPNEAGAALDRAEEAGLVVVDSGIRFTHPLLAAAVYGGATALDRRRMHGRLARLVDDVEDRARHLALSAAGPDEAVAAELEAAADRARRRGAPDAAADLAEQAIALTPDDRAVERERRTIEAADYHFHSGEMARAREAVTHLLDGPIRGRARGQALRLLADIRNHQDSFTDAVELYRQALDHADGDRELEATVELGIAWASAAFGLFADAEPHARRALEAARATDEPSLIGQALAVTTMVDFLLGRGVDEDRLAEALRLEDPHRRTTVEMRPTLIAGYLRLYEGRLDEGRELLSALRTLILERGEETDLPFVADELAWIEAWAGRLDVAESYVAESLAAARNVGSRSIQGLASSFAAFVYGWQGRAADTLAASAAADAAAAEAGWPVAALWGRWGRAVLALSTATPKGAREALAPLIDAVDAEGVSEPIRAGFVPEAVEALIGLGELDRAERLLGQFEAAAVRLDRSWARLAAARNRLQLLTARGDPAGALEIAEAALGDPVVERFPFEQARILLAQGRAARRSRHRGDADRALRAAAVLFERGGARAWATLAIDEARRTGFVRSGPELTPSEQRIASLVAEGMTNRAVADRLFISPKTVEATLARTYAKLGISSRAQLGAVMAARSSAARETRDDTSGQTAAAE